MSKQTYILALFKDFEEAARTLATLREASIPGFRMRDVTLKSPIDHPECAAELGPRPVYVQIFSLLGAALTSSLGFLWIASSQANFLRQQRGGFPIVPIPPDMVITYELFILGSVFFTITACLIVWRMHRVGTKLYDVKISVDKIGILVKANVGAMPRIREIFSRHHALEITEAA